MKKYVIIIAAFSLLHNSCVNTEDNFVRIENGRFKLNGMPYYFLGVNFWHGAYLGADLMKGDRQRLVDELDLLAANGITNLRIMASSEESDLEASVKPAFQSAPGVFNQQLLEGLDFLLSEMGKRNMKAVLVLNNYWQWSGGMSQYMNWITGNSIIDPDLTGDWDGFQKQSAAFYTNFEANEFYRDYILMLVNRNNSLSGRLYKNDPVIMAWQLANEPRPAPGADTNVASSRAFITWVKETASFIHEIAPDQLVSTGNEGSQGSRQSMELFEEAHATDEIDYLTFHIWPKNWNWFDAKRPEETFKVTLHSTEEYFADHIRMAEKLNKPLVLEEFGIERDLGSFSPHSPTTYRDEYLEILFRTVVKSVKAGNYLAGLNFWAWGGIAQASNDDFKWRKGDSFMGDPPQEPQGLNSVFASDNSTLEIFKKYNRLLSELNL